MSNPEDNIKQISNLVKFQFPDFYRESGPEFILFLQAYYEWLEEQGGVVNDIRSLFEYDDIDTTPDAFLIHFREKFMSGLPLDVIGNQRLFQKHILDLYRSKGSVAGLKLLFRLLFNEDISIYVPSYDIFKASDGVWVEDHYLEVTDSEYLNQLSGKTIVGTSSGARAVVELITKMSMRGKRVCLIHVSNIHGIFTVGELIAPDPFNSSAFDFNKLPYILGSPSVLTVQNSNIGYEVGDVLETADLKPVKAVVTEVERQTGVITFDLEYGGTYYSTDAVVSITAGTNSSGTGAAFVIGQIGNTQPFNYVDGKLDDLANVALNATSYGIPSNPAANSQTILAQAFDIKTVNVGTIQSIIVTNPGVGYDGSVTVTITDPYSSSRGIYDGRGGYSGTNALVTGSASNGDGKIRNLKVLDSGYGYNTDQETITLNSDKGPSTVRVNLGAVGFSEGRYDSTRGFLSSDKYLFDGHYYQDFSYVIKSQQNLAKYIEILRKTVHSAGNAIFGEINLQYDFDIIPSERNDTVVQSSYDESVVFNFADNRAVIIDKNNANNNYSGAVAGALTVVRSTTAMYFDKDGKMKSAAPDQLRLDYDPITRQPKGALAENLVTNLLLRSGDLSASPWSWGSVVPGTIVAGDIAPLESENFWLITSTGPLSDRRQNITVTADTRQVYSVFIKKGHTSYAGFQVHFLGGTGTEIGWVLYNFDTNSLTSSGAIVVSRGVEEVGEGVYRLWLELLPTGGQVSSYLLLHRGTQIQAGDTAQYWGVQCEYVTTLGKPTSYIPTGGAQSIRSGDIITKPLAELPYNANAGTLVVEVDDNNLTAPIANRYYAGFTVGTSSTSYNGIRLSTDNTVSGVIFGSDTTQMPTPASYVAGIKKIAITWDTTSLSFSMNGSTPASVPLTVFPTGFDCLTILSLAGLNSFCPIAHIRDLNYLPKKVSDSELQGLTS